MTYPTPATPLPWHGHKADITAVRSVMGSQDTRYIVHAANAFPHLVAALEEIAKGNTEATKLSLRALAIARGELKK